MDTPAARHPERTDPPTGHPGEPHAASAASRLNWLRAGVLGANDGVVSTSGLVIGVAAASASDSAILAAGMAGLAAGALSMGVGEYVSVSTQRDTETALLAKERHELATMPEEELEELAALYAAKGLDPELAREVAVQLTAHDALGAHAEVELGLDEDELTNPWQAAAASMLAFTLGALIPLLTILLLPPSVRVAGTAVAAAAVLALAGWSSAVLGGAAIGRAVARNVGGGILAMAITYGVGALVGTSVG